MVKGAIRWQVPLGIFNLTDPNGPAGTISLGGPITTASGLVFIAGTFLDPHLRAFDVETGKLLWKAELPVPAHATPMTYECSQSLRNWPICAPRWQTSPCDVRPGEERPSKASTIPRGSGTSCPQYAFCESGQDSIQRFGADGFHRVLVETAVRIRWRSVSCPLSPTRNSHHYGAPSLRLSSNPSCRFACMHDLHAKIHEDDFGDDCRRRLHCLLSIEDCLDVVSLLAEYCSQRQGRILIVVHDQNAARMKL